MQRVEVPFFEPVSLEARRLSYLGLLSPRRIMAGILPEIDLEGIDRALQETSVRGLNEAGRIVQSHNLSPYIIGEWLVTSGCSPQDAAEIITMNVRCLGELEKAREGIGSTLQGKFNLTAFGRYPEEMLIGQFDDVDKFDGKPHGIVIFCRGDESGAFYNERDILRTLAAGLEGKLRLRIWEARDIMSLSKALIYSGKYYGKAPFGMINGHGNPKNGIALDRMPSEYLSKQEFAERGTLADIGFRVAFERNALLVLNACKTDVPLGLGENLRRLAEFKVIGPETDTHIVSMRLLKSRIPKLSVRFKREPVRRAAIPLSPV